MPLTAQLKVRPFKTCATRGTPAFVGKFRVCDPRDKSKAQGDQEISRESSDSSHCVDMKQRSKAKAALLDISASRDQTTNSRRPAHSPNEYGLRVATPVCRGFCHANRLYHYCRSNRQRRAACAINKSGAIRRS